MPTYLIEVPHSPEECAADRRPAFPAPTYWGCGAGRHTSWTLVDLADEAEGWQAVPACLRDTARVIAVERSSEVPDPRGGAA
jgi:hypothetical protein